MGIYIKGLDFYPVLVRRDGRLFEARFVDIPNCVAYGSSAILAETRAADALGAYADRSAKSGVPLPAATVLRGASNHRDRYVAYIKSPLHHTRPIFEPIAPEREAKAA